MKQSNKNIKFTRKLRNISLLNKKIIFDKKILHNLSSNDYLSLSRNKDLISASNLWTKNFGTSLSSSRLISGNFDKIGELEKKIAKHKSKQEAIILGSGFQCNITAIPAIIENSLGKRTKAKIFSDKYNHSSIQIGCMISNQRTFRYNHLDYNHLESLLKKADKNELKLIISETVFSMDGDVAEISNLRYLAKKYNCLIYFDEAHASGVFGKNGFGFTSDRNKNEETENEIAVGTFSKAFGSYGSYISCSKKIKDRIINKCTGFIYSTALPPGVLGAIDCATEKIPKMKNERCELIQKSKYLKKKLKKLDLFIGKTSSQIIPIIFSDAKFCISLSNIMLASGYYILPIMPPTVPYGKSRLRVSLTSFISKKVIDGFIKILEEQKRK